MAGHDHQNIDRQSSLLAFIARIWWMFLGNVIPAFCLVFIYDNTRGFFQAADIVFWVTVASLVLVRYLDIRFLNGRTASGDAPASIRHWVKYTVLLLACSAGVWALAHALSYLFVAGTAQS